MPISQKVKGTGLNSIPIRFALMSAVFLCAVAALEIWLLDLDNIGEVEAGTLVVAVLVLAVPPLITYLAAGKLSGMIKALSTSAKAIVEGDFDAPVDVHCDCEVGELADSFRTMVSRMNANILRINSLAFSDMVTGLPNRAVVSHILSLVKENPDDDCISAMMFIDLDGFKRINDCFGHDVGDDLLRHVSERIITGGFDLDRDDLDSCTTTFGELCETCPSKLVVARFAGDEFLVMVPGKVTEEELAAHADRILAAVAKPFNIQGHEINIGASIGIALRTDGMENSDKLLVHADIAMYSAKESGKQRYCFFDRSLKEKMDERALLEADLHGAIETDQLSLHYQPKIDAQTLQLTAVEALARWRHPQLGMVAPDKFIAIAEQCGLMVSLGDSILRMAAKQIRTWIDEGTPRPVAVNVSAVQFDQHDLARRVLEILDRYNVPPSMLRLEITESMAMSNVGQVAERIAQLRNAGISISIDDFGTGYSNLSQLARLNFDTLKIDRSLVRGIGINPKSELMLKAIVSLARALGHAVIAEGIETIEQLRFLVLIGCDRLQGYLIGRPMPAEELRDWSLQLDINPVGDILGEIDTRLEPTSLFAVTHH